MYYYNMKRTAIRTRIAVFTVGAALCAFAASAQQSIQQQPAFQPAPAPLQLQQPVQAQPPPQPAYQSAPPPVQQLQPVQAQTAPPPPPPPPPGVQPGSAAPEQGEAANQAGGGAGTAKPAAPKPPSVLDAESSARLGVELSAEALAAAPYLYYDNGKSPGVGRVAFPRDRDVYQRFDKAVVKPTGSRLPFTIGDTVDVLKYIGRFKVGGERTCLMARTARGVVLGFAGKNAVVRLIDLWGTVAGSERVVKSASFVPLYVDNKKASGTADVKAKVILHIDKTVAPFMHQYIIIDKGSEAGVKIGDFFRVTDRRRSDYFPEELAEAQVLNVTAKASTLVLQKVYGDRLEFGDEACLSFRAVEKK
jgi:hypothetical protein